MIFLNRLTFLRIGTLCLACVVLQSLLTVGSAAQHPNPPFVSPSKMLAQAQQEGHVLNLLEYTRALAAAYGPTTEEVQGPSLAQPSVAADDGQYSEQHVPHHDLNSSLSFSNPQAKVYEVGNRIPYLNLTTKTSWAGVIPVDPHSNLTAAYLTELPKKAGQNNYTMARDAPRSLFFWLWGSEGPKASKDDLVIWLQGGPGCSSLYGFFCELGTIRYDNITRQPRLANDSWMQVADVVFVDQPVGTGFAMGFGNATDENDVSREFYGFWTNFMKIFPELRRKRLWIAAESYGGIYGPYLADHFYKQKDTYNLQGLLLIDGFITNYNLAQGATTYDFVLARNDTLQLHANSTPAILNATRACGYENYSRKNLRYPLDHSLPPTPYDKCSTFETYSAASYASNPYFNFYDIRWKADFANTLYNPFGNPNSFVPKDDTFLSMDAVRDYLHAPHIEWTVCGGQPFLNGVDRSVPPVDTILAPVIEKNKRTIIAHGFYDGLLLQNGTAIALQNLTWSGARGFKHAPTKVMLDQNGNRAGTFTTGRNLSFVVAERAGHTIPGDDGLVGLALIRSLLGQRSLGGGGKHMHGGAEEGGHEAEKAVMGALKDDAEDYF